MNYLIKNAHAILTGLAGEAARIQADSIRIGNGVTTEIGSSLSLHTNETVIDARDCVIYPAWVNTHHHLFQSLLKGEPQVPESKFDTVVGFYTLSVSWGF